MEELFEIFNEAGKPAGLEARSRVHELGLWHCAVNVLLFTADGRLVVQRRQSTKDVCPGLWDLSVAEHVQPDEDHLDAARRGLREELGVSGCELVELTGLLCTRLDVAALGIKDYELQKTYRARCSGGRLEPNAEEVAEIKLYAIGDLETAMREMPGEFTPWFKDRAIDVGLFG